MASANPAPGELELVRAFVNTWDAEDGTETLDSPEALVGWLREQRLLDRPAHATGEQRDQAVELRESLRAILLHHDGLELDPGAGPVLDAAARRAGLAVVYDEHAGARVEPLAAGVDGALGRLLKIVADAQREGTWERLKVCPADDCQWAFYDRSRNRSAVWCDMRSCGNRAKVRSYRERRRPDTSKTSA
jgi:predicted RNA-binding Zn ribbon-like protein